MIRDPSKRKINAVYEENLPQITPIKHWHILDCQLITPMYGGGVISNKVDTAMPIRVSGIRGQLRFWWRLLAKHQWQLGSDQAIRKAEFELWGGMNDGEDSGKASKVLLKVTQVSTIHDNHLIKYDDATLNGLRYILFPAYHAKDITNNLHHLLKADITWQLQFAFSPNILSNYDKTANNKPNPKEQVIETLRWWANFGGLGFRSRRGVGAVYVSQCQDYPEICQPLTPDEVAKAGCQLAISQNNPTDGLRALKTAVQKLSSFRQAANVGRNPPSGQAISENKPAGRSRWPEPDALRRIQGNLGYDRRHEPEHKAGNVFARAIFGLPILFQPHQEKAINATVEPAFGDRLASPLILRPIYAGDRNGQPQWQAGALVLPYEHLLTEKVKIGDHCYPIWQDDAAQNIIPVRDNGGGDPIQAFLRYFKK